MVTCPTCNEHVNNARLRSDTPSCENGHEMGRWVSCRNEKEKHVYLSLNESKCPYCESLPGTSLDEGARVKCLHSTTDGVTCPTRAFLWKREGPPCFMNHVGKMGLE